MSIEDRGGYRDGEDTSWNPIRNQDKAVRALSCHFLLNYRPSLQCRYLKLLDSLHMSPGLPPLAPAPARLVPKNARQFQ